MHADGVDVRAAGDADDLEAIRRFAVAWLRREQDLDLRYTWVHNPKLGYVAEQVIGRTDADLVGSDTAAALSALKRQAIATGDPVRAEVAVAAPGGESVAQVSARVARARQRLLQRHAGRTVLVVSHVTPIKLLLAAALEADDAIVHRVFLDAASFCTVAWSSDGRASVRLVNDTAHLR